MITTTERTKECIFCKTNYTYEEKYDDGRDWEGHQRGGGRSWIVSDECPMCHGDIRQAVKILDEREANEKEERSLLEYVVKNDRQFVEVKFTSTGKTYLYYIQKDKEFVDGMYEINTKEYISRCMARLILPEEIEKMDIDLLKILADDSRIKPFRGTYIQDIIYECYEKDLAEYIKEKKFEKAHICLDILEYADNNNFYGLLDYFTRRRGIV